MGPQLISMAGFLAEIAVAGEARGTEEDSDPLGGAGAAVGILMMSRRRIFRLGVVDEVVELRIAGPAYRETTVMTGLLVVDDHQAGHLRLGTGIYLSSFSLYKFPKLVITTPRQKRGENLQKK